MIKQKMDIYSIHNEMGLEKKIHKSDLNNIWKWSGVYSTGDFEGLFDYDAGILEVGISMTKSMTKHISYPAYTIMFHINTIDDGAWDACDRKEDYTEEEARNRMNEIAEAFISFMKEACGLKLPCEKDLNDFLSKFKLWGENTG